MILTSAGLQGILLLLELKHSAIRLALSEMVSGVQCEENLN